MIGVHWGEETDTGSDHENAAVQEWNRELRGGSTDPPTPSGQGMKTSL